MISDRETTVNKDSGRSLTLPGLSDTPTLDPRSKVVVRIGRRRHRRAQERTIEITRRTVM